MRFKGPTRGMCYCFARARRRSACPARCTRPASCGRSRRSWAKRLRLCESFSGLCCWSRASLLLQNSQALQSAIQGGLIEREGDQASWNYLAWDAQAKREIKDTTIAPMTHDRLLRRIKTLQEDAKEDIILRFHGVRPLTEDLQGKIYTMLLEVGTNGEREQNVHTCLRDLCNLSVWRLLAGRFRRDRLQRTPLANRISESLQ